MISEELRVVVRAEAAQAIRELQTLQKTSTGNTNAFKDMAKAMIGIGGVTAALVATKRIVFDNIKAGIDFAAAIEKQTVAFEVLLGNADKANKFMKDIQDFSASTPFQLPDLTSAAQRLLGFGTAAEDVIKVMRQLGDLSMGNSEVLGRLTLAYGKLQAKGKATLEEINMFTEAGVPLMKALEEQTGKAGDELFKMISNGEIRFEQVNDAIRTMTSEGGQFYDMTNKQAETLSGTLSTLQDNLSILKAAMVESIVDPLKDAVDWAIKLAKQLQEGARQRKLGEDFTQNLAFVQSRGFSRLGIEDQIQALQDTISGFQYMKNQQSLIRRPIEQAKYGDTITGLEQTLKQLQQTLEYRQHTLGAGAGNAPPPVPTAPPIITVTNGGSVFVSGSGFGTGSFGGQIMGGAGVVSGMRVGGVGGGTGPYQYTYGGGAVGSLAGGTVGMGGAFGGMGGGGIYRPPFIGTVGQFSGGAASFNAYGPNIRGGATGGGAYSTTPQGAMFANELVDIKALTDEDIAAIERLKPKVEDLADVFADLGDSIQKAFGQNVLDAAYTFGQSLASGAKEGEALAGAIEAFWKSFIDQLPQMLLAASAQAAVAQNWPLAAALLAAAAGTSVVSGAINTPPPERGRPTTSGVSITVNGDINDADRFEEKVMSAVAKSRRAY